MISNSLRDCLCRFRVISQVSKIGRFWAKSLNYSTWFWTWRILASPVNRSNSLKRHRNPPETIFNFFRDSFCWFRDNLQGSKFGRFWAKRLGYSPWFWTWRISQVLEIAPDSLKRFLNLSKIISNTLRDCLCQFRVNWQGSKFGRFWAKTLGYSPWFWTWRIFARPF